MRKLFILASVVLCTLSQTSCSYDDSDLWNAVDNVTDRVEALEQATKDINSDIEALQSIVNALQKNVTVSSVEQTENGYTIKFSDGTTATISNGVDGVNAPEISIRQDEDGNYYWTLGGEWLTIDDKKVSAVAPSVRINPDTKMWEISTDNGTTWTSTEVTAEGKDGDSIFSGIDTSNKDYITFTLSDGTTIKVPRFDETAPTFTIEGLLGAQIISCGTSKDFNVTYSNVAEYSIQKPDGWKVNFDGKKLTVTAPAEANIYAEKSGYISIILISESRKSFIVKFRVATSYSLRTLTFEDDDAQFPSYKLNYCNATISTWSDLIDEIQYGGSLLYGSGGGMMEPYTWHDKGNTELKHVMPQSYGSYCYWGGGHAISNYYSTDLATSGFDKQLDVYGTSGHNGSANFCMHYGYRDSSPYSASNILPAIEFGDGEARTIDHIWVNNSTYAMGCYISGNSLTDKIGANDWVKLVATGFDADGNKIAESSIYMVNGPENIIRDWTKWELSSLGNVAKVEFNVIGSSDNGYGFSQPAYFAYDDVAVRFIDN